MTIWHFQNDLIKHKKIKKTELMQTFSTFGKLAQIWKLGPISHKKGKISILFFINILQAVKHFQNGFTEHKKVKITELIWTFQFWTNMPEYRN